MSAIRILIGDDHPIVREGLKRIVSSHPDLVVAAEASTSAEVVDLVRRESFDVVVLDISMPGRGGLDVLAELKRMRPKLPVLVLTIHPEEQLGIRALRAGAAGYLNKESAAEKMVTAIRRVIEGHKYVSPALAERLAAELASESRHPLHEALSNREYQVMTLLASGKTVSEIAKDLSLSVKTISTDRARILEKMNMRTNAELTRYALDNRLIQ